MLLKNDTAGGLPEALASVRSKSTRFPGRELLRSYQARLAAACRKGSRLKRHARLGGMACEYAARDGEATRRHRGPAKPRESVVQENGARRDDEERNARSGKSIGRPDRSCESRSTRPSQISRRRGRARSRMVSIMAEYRANSEHDRRESAPCWPEDATWQVRHLSDIWVDSSRITPVCRARHGDLSTAGCVATHIPRNRRALFV
jgi:hypothetical protein